MRSGGFALGARHSRRARKMLGREKIEPQRGSATQTITRVDCLVSKARDRARAEFFASRARGGARSPCLTRGGGLPKWITQPKAFAQPSAARHLPTRRPRAPARPPRAGGKVAARLSSPRSSCSSSCASSSSSLFARPRSSFGRAHESSWSRFARARRASAGRELASLRPHRSAGVHGGVGRRRVASRPAE